MANCWQRDFLKLNVENTDINGVTYVNTYISDEKEDQDRGIFLFQSLALSEYLTEIHNLMLSGLEDTLIPLEEGRDLLERFLSEDDVSAQDIIHPLLGSYN